MEHKPHHQLLVTLLLCNAVANEAMPLFLDSLVPSWCAIIISVTAVLFGGEIVPSAIFTGPAKLQIASSLSGLVWFVMFALTPLAWPIAKVLDACIPHEHGYITRYELRAMVEVTRELWKKEQEHGGHGGGDGEEEGMLHEDEEDMIRGAIELSITKVRDCEKLLPMDKLYFLRTDQRLDRETMEELVAMGHSRVPIKHVLHGVELVIGYILVKDHITLDPDDGVLIADLVRDKPEVLYFPAIVSPEITLRALLNEFQYQSCHMCFVSDNPKKWAEASRMARKDIAEGGQGRGGNSSGTYRFDARIKGMLTLEDIIEVLLTEEIVDERDMIRAQREIAQFVQKIVVPQFRKDGSSRELVNLLTWSTLPSKPVHSRTLARFFAPPNACLLKLWRP